MATERLTRQDGYPHDWEPPRRASVEEFRRISDASDKRYEYRDGWMWLRGYPPTYRLGMAGGTWAHADLTRAIQRRLEDATASTPCRVGNQDIELWVSDNQYYFPDAFVICGQPHDPRSRSARDPVLVVEVLSESTAETDRGDKLEDYLALSSMREYLLLETRKVGGTLYRREGDAWVIHLLRAADTLRLVSVNLELALSDLYEHTGLLEAD